MGFASAQRTDSGLCNGPFSMALRGLSAIEWLLAQSPLLVCPVIKLMACNWGPPCGQFKDTEKNTPYIKHRHISTGISQLLIIGDLAWRYNSAIWIGLRQKANSQRRYCFWGSFLSAQLALSERIYTPRSGRPISRYETECPFRAPTNTHSATTF